MKMLACILVGPQGIPVRQMRQNSTENWIQVDGREVPVRFRRHRRARHYILRVEECGALRITLPSYGSQREALSFAERQRDWLSLQLMESDARRDASRWTDGTVFPFRGKAVRLAVEEELFGVTIRFADQVLNPAAYPEDLRAIVADHLRSLAAVELPARARELAAEHGFQPKRITVRAQRTLWGSCSTGGAISLNWKLITVPDWVRDYIIIHELAHLAEFNHSRGFWATVRKSFPRYREAERWLKKHERLQLSFTP